VSAIFQRQRARKAELSANTTDKESPEDEKHDEEGQEEEEEDEQDEGGYCENEKTPCESAKPNLTLRPATEDDVQCVAEIWWAAYHDSHGAVVPPELLQQRTPKSFLERVRPRLPNTTVAVGPGDDGLVGFYILKGTEVEQLFLSAKNRRQGIGKALLFDAEAKLRGKGVSSAFLVVACGNLPACGFYERCGWLGQWDPIVYHTEIGKEIFYNGRKCSTFPLECYRYEKKLI